MLLLCALFAGIPGVRAEALEIPEGVPLTLRLEQEPRGFEGPLSQYVVIRRSWTREDFYQRLRPYIAPGFQNLEQAMAGGERCYYQSSFGPDAKEHDGSPMDLMEPVRQVAVPARSALAAPCIQGLRALGFGDGLWLQGLMTIDEWLESKATYQPAYRDFTRKFSYEDNPPEALYYAAVGQSLAGYRLAVQIAEASESHSAENLCSFLLDKDGLILRANMVSPLEIIGQTPAAQRVLSWRECVPKLIESRREYWGENGEVSWDYPFSPLIRTKSSYELIAAEPVYMLRNLDDGRYQALPAWQFTLRQHEYLLYTQEHQQRYGGSRELNTVRYEDVVISALQEEP